MTETPSLQAWQSRARGLLSAAVGAADESAVAIVAELPPEVWPDILTQQIALCVADLVERGVPVDEPAAFSEYVDRFGTPSGWHETTLIDHRTSYPERDGKWMFDTYRQWKRDEARDRLAGGACTPEQARELLAVIEGDDDEAEPWADDLSNWRELARQEVPLLTSGIPLAAATVVASTGGLGKSSLARLLALSVLTGRTLAPCFPVSKQGRVVFLSGEDPPNIFVGSMLAMGIRYGIPGREMDEAMTRLTLRGSRPFRILEDGEPSAAYREFATVCRKSKPSLVIVDTIRKHFGGDSENDSTQAGAWMQLAQDIASETGAAVVTLHHASKGNENGVSVRGSSAWTDEARAAFTLARTDTGFILHHAKANWTAKIPDVEFNLTNGVPEQVATQVRDLGAVGDAVAEWLAGNADAAVTVGGLRSRQGKDARELAKVIAMEFPWCDSRAAAEAAEQAIGDGRLELVDKVGANRNSKKCLAVCTPPLHTSKKGVQEAPHHPREGSRTPPPPIKNIGGGVQHTSEANFPDYDDEFIDGIDDGDLF